MSCPACVRLSVPPSNGDSGRACPVLCVCVWHAHAWPTVSVSSRVPRLRLQSGSFVQELTQGAAPGGLRSCSPLTVSAARPGGRRVSPVCRVPGGPSSRHGIRSGQGGGQEAGIPVEDKLFGFRRRFLAPFLLENATRVS